MPTRDEILNKLRTTLNRADLVFPPYNPPPLTAATRMVVTHAEGDSRALADRFGRELTALHGSCEVVESVIEARLALISRLLAWISEADAERRSSMPLNGQERKVLAWAPDRLPTPGLADALTDMGIELVTPAQLQTSAAREAVRHIRYGVTGVEAAFASTGSLLMASGEGASRAASLLPLRHIALIPTSRLFPTMEAWLASLRAEDRLTDTLRTYAALAMVTGPSKSADIGGELTLGVHGPKFVHGILYLDE